jgi:hypothetical protein
MRQQRHFGSPDLSLREATQTKSLIADLDRIVQIIESDISLQEDQAQTSDCAHANYPLGARILAARRDNLKQTIALLERRLSSGD